MKKCFSTGRNSLPREVLEALINSALPDRALEKAEAAFERKHLRERPVTLANIGRNARRATRGMRFGPA